MRFSRHLQLEFEALPQTQGYRSEVGSKGRVACVSRPPAGPCRKQALDELGGYLLAESMRAVLVLGGET
jgi:hypothetical protein